MHIACIMLCLRTTLKKVGHDVCDRSEYLTIIPQAHVGYEMIDSQRGATHLVGYNHLISNKCEWNNYYY